MNNKKGFTLIEVIGVVVILALIILIIVPTISTSLGNSRKKIYNNQINEIVAASKAWGALNSLNLPKNEGDKITITLLQLKLAGLLPISMENPLTGDLFPDDLQIEISKKGLNYIYKVLEDSGTINLPLDPTAPPIILSGSSYVAVEINSEYVDAGARYKNPDNTYTEINDYEIYRIVNSNEEKVTSIDTSSLGKFSISYSVTVGDKTSTIKRYINIVDTKPPVVAIEGFQNNICVNEKIRNNFILPTASVTDNSGELLEALSYGNFSPKIPGTKKIQYIAKDSSGNTGEFNLCLNMYDDEKPVIINVSKQYNSVLDKLIVTVTAEDTGVGLHEYAYSFDNGQNWQKENYKALDPNIKEDCIIVVKDKLGLQSTLRYITNFEYSGTSKEFVALYTGWYQIELWGAAGHQSAGKGGYINGIIKLEKNEKIYLYVGQNLNTPNSFSYNGGGSSDGGMPGGGATDIRLDSTLNSRIMVAGGGGYLANGGNLIGGSTSTATGGTQISGGSGGGVYSSGTFGLGGNGCGGGGGYYGGGGNLCANGSGGGSSFISGYAGVNAITTDATITHSNNTLHYSGKYFINGKMKSGVNEGNGKAAITYTGENKPERKNTKLDNVRYIKSCVNGNSANAGDHWVELQAIKDGVNIAYNKVPVGTTSPKESYPYTRITDGNIRSDGYYAETSVVGLQCITVDLGQTYNLDELALWLYWIGGRTYYQNTLSVGSTNVSGTAPLSTVLHTYSGINGYVETSDGRRYSAYE